MEDYDESGAENFVQDPLFCKWVKQPDLESDAYWMEWLRANPQQSKTIGQARRLILLVGTDTGKDPDQETVDRMWQDILLRTQPEAIIRPLASTRKWLYLAAASISLILFAFMVYRYQIPALNTYVTYNGEIRRLQLSDGTLVTLNANSELRVSKDWNGAKTREVWVEGEAFFNVKEKIDSGQPVKFLVHTDDVDVEVKGTQFNVNTRQQETNVVLAEGKVQLRFTSGNGEKAIDMKPGDHAKYMKAGKAVSVDHLSDTDHFLSWKDNRWTFQKTPLSEIAVLIKDTYGVQITFDDVALAEKKVTGIFPSDNLEDIIASLESILGVQILWQADGLVVRKGSLPSIH